MIINWQLAKHPMNWVIVTLMLVIAGIAGHLALTYFGVSPATGPEANKLPEQITPATSPVKLRYDGTFAARATS